MSFYSKLQQKKTHKNQYFLVWKKWNVKFWHIAKSKSWEILTHPCNCKKKIYEIKAKLKWSKIFLTQCFHDAMFLWCEVFMTRSFHDAKFLWRKVFMTRNFHDAMFHAAKISWCEVFMTQSFHDAEFSWHKVFMTQSFHDAKFLWHDIFMTRSFHDAKLGFLIAKKKFDEIHTSCLHRYVHVLSIVWWRSLTL